MKKLFAIAVLAASLTFVGGAAQVEAAGPHYLYFSDYCDCMTLFRHNAAGHTWLVGTWDWECTGSSSTPIAGGVEGRGAIIGTQPIDSVGNPAGFSAAMTIEDVTAPVSGHSHIIATFDGVTPVLIDPGADYFLRFGPPCPTVPNPSGKPRMFPAQ